MVFKIKLQHFNGFNETLQTLVVIPLKLLFLAKVLVPILLLLTSFQPSLQACFHEVSHNNAINTN